MTPDDFDWLRKLVKHRSGIVLTAEKQYLLESRLLPLARREGMGALAELVARLKMPGTESLAFSVIEAMTTNETFFFRDKVPFEHLKDTVLPGLIAARAREKRIRIWCAAAASGQEPYSIAMLLKSMAPQLRGYRVDLLATDLSYEMIERDSRCSAGCRFIFWCVISPNAASSGRSRRNSATWCNSAPSTFFRISRRLVLSMSYCAGTC
jgi:chemotaxis protein methyltransferase CheR